MSKVNILLTGATGLIGRHILYELIRLFNADAKQVKIFLPIRSANGQSAQQRLKQLFERKHVPEDIRNNKISILHVIETDVSTNESRRVLQNSVDRVKDLIVIHSAGTTNLATEEKMVADIVKGICGITNIIFDTLDNHMKKFIYISTAFVGGVRGGIIDNNLLNIDNRIYRNLYEKYKAITEKELADRCIRSKIEIQILRPSIVCGRLIDEKLYYTSKFDVFYAFARFMALVKRTKYYLPLRIAVNKDSGLNIVPVDYVAKAVCKLIFDSVKEMNIVHSNCLPHTYYIPEICRMIGVSNVQLVDSVPSDPNDLEKLYYRTVGAQFTPYVTTPKHEFDIRLLRRVMRNIEEPSVLKNFPSLLSFAIKNNFKLF
ncbi:MAG: SDR family oxidoreductase [bacterium]